MTGLPTTTPAEFQLTAARRRLLTRFSLHSGTVQFQLTAARRRLLGFSAAMPYIMLCFNSQPPEGGCRAPANNTAQKSGV